MLIRDIRLAGMDVMVTALGTYEELAKLGIRTPPYQHDHMVSLDLIVYKNTMEKLEAADLLTSDQKAYIRLLYDKSVAMKEEWHAKMAAKVRRPVSEWAL